MEKLLVIPVTIVLGIGGWLMYLRGYNQGSKDMLEMMTYKLADKIAQLKAKVESGNVGEEKEE